MADRIGSVVNEFSDVIAAGIVLFRLAQLFLHIPIGLVAVGLWRRQITKRELPDRLTLQAGSIAANTENDGGTQ